MVDTIVTKFTFQDLIDLTPEGRVLLLCWKPRGCHEIEGEKVAFCPKPARVTAMLICSAAWICHGDYQSESWQPLLYTSC